MGKHQEIREKRSRQQKKKRLILIGIIAGIAVIAAGIMIALTAGLGNKPAFTPIARPQAANNAMGDPNAPVKIQEYADFQCPACRRFFQNIEPEIIDNYISTGKVYYEFIPLGFLGQESLDAAQAAYCALDQGKFWEYHDILFTNQTGENIGDFSIKKLKSFADKLDLNIANFNSCLESGTYKDKVVNNFDTGKSLGIEATPSFIVNGKVVYSDVLINTIDKELAK